MNQIKSNLYDCHHCGGDGTCRNGASGESCAACVKKNELRGKGYTGLICGSCGGIGQAEPMTERMNKRAAPMLANILTCFLLVLVFWAAGVKSPYFSEILAFSSAVIGSVIGFYFSNRAANT